jgi:hypothetical protein
VKPLSAPHRGSAQARDESLPSAPARIRHANRRHTAAGEAAVEGNSFCLKTSSFFEEKEARRLWLLARCDGDARS